MSSVSALNAASSTAILARVQTTAQNADVSPARAAPTVGSSSAARVPSSIASLSLRTAECHAPDPDGGRGAPDGDADDL